jgi:hypothetical protein
MLHAAEVKLADHVIGNPIQDGFGRKITIPLFTMR